MSKFYRQFEKHFALAVITLSNNTFHVGEEGVWEIGRTIFGSKTADIKSDGLFDELRFAAAVILPV